MILAASSLFAIPWSFTIHSNVAESTSICAGGTAAGFPNLNESETNVTTSLPAVASGVSVREITSPSSGYSASFVYYDTPVYSKATDKIVYYVYPQHGPDLIVAANIDGSSPQVIGQSYANPIITSDGKMVIYASPGTSPNSADMYAINLTLQGACKSYRFSNYSFPQGSIAGSGSYAPVYYYSEYDTAASQDLIYIWQYNAIYRIFENGTSLPTVTIPDPYASPWATFHHLKPNPMFPNIVAYLWDQLNGTIGTPETYVVNLNNPTEPYLVFNSTNQGHENWAQNGQQLGDADWPYWIAASVLNSNGSILAFSKPIVYTYPQSIPLYSLFGIVKIGPNIAAENSTTAVEYAPQYCAWGPNGGLLACSSISGNRSSSEYGNMPIYMLYLNGTAKFVVSTDSRLLSYWGEPALIFLNDSNHIIYRSDHDGSPQLYEITLGNGFSQPGVTTVLSSSSTVQIAVTTPTTSTSSTSSVTSLSNSPTTESSTKNASSTEVSSHLAVMQGNVGTDYALYILVLMVAAGAVVLGFRRIRKRP
jgi:hypothetical protein